MKRSWIAFGVVVLAIIALVAYQVAFRGKGEEPSEEQGGKPAPAKPDTATPAPPKASPTTETPTKGPEPEKSKEPIEQPKKEPAAEPKKAEGPAAEAVLKNAEALIAAGKKVEAQQLLSDAITKGPRPANLQPIKDRLSKLNDELLFSAKPSPLSVTHTITTPNENLTNIARQHKTTPELIQRINGIKNPNVIHLNQKLKVLPGAFDVEVSKGQFLLTVYRKGIWVRELKVGLGKDGVTPVGEFLAGTRIAQPPYTAHYPHVAYGDKKNNPLGTHWITIKGAGDAKLGIHGTWEPDSIGKEGSKGCVRLTNADVEWLYALVVPGESKITVKP